MKNPELHNFTAKRELIIKLIEKFDLDSKKILVNKTMNNYAKKHRNELEDKVKLAKRLWA